MRNTILLSLLVFFFALSFRLWNLNMMGDTWDEGWSAGKGYIFFDLAKSGNFTNDYWWKDLNHPPLSPYLYGPAASLDFVKYEKISSDIFYKGHPVLQYDLTYSRLVSAVLSALAVVIIFLTGKRYFSLYIGLVAAMVFAMVPHFLGYSQLVTIETVITFFFTAAAFSYLLFFEKKSNRYLILSGILTGFALEAKQTDALLIILLFGMFFIWKRLHPKDKKITWYQPVFIFVISVITYFIVWPMQLFHMNEIANVYYNMWFKNGGRIPELLFGIHMGAPIIFYIIAFFVTTPLVLILLSFFGIKITYSKHTFNYWSVLLWFFVPFLTSIFHERQQMVRYIVEFYAPFSLLCAIAFETFVKKFVLSSTGRYIAIIPLFVYLFLILLSISPYYLDYYNELVGGTKMVYKHQLFFLGEWGQGLRGPGIYIANHAKPNSIIGVATDPQLFTLYQNPKLKYKIYNPQNQYAYVVVNTFNDFRIGFNEKQLDKNYSIVYREKADGADIAHVYKHK